MIANLPPAVVIILGAVLVPFLRGRARSAWLLALPVIGFVHLLGLEEGRFAQFRLLDFDIELLRVDKLSTLFGILFHIAAFTGFLFSWHVRDLRQQLAAVLYVAGALWVVYAGDLLSVWVGWELLALTSVFLIWARRTPESYRAGIRYLGVQFLSGLALLVGTLCLLYETGDTSFESMTEAMRGGSLGTWIIFFAFGLKCCFPGLHTWLTDGYPAATVTGCVFLSGFTTKVAVYVMARGYPGAELLVWIGTAMAVFPIFYAVIENDLRRVLGYSMINQIGFMMVGVGIGSAMGINGAVAHAFNDVFFKGLLFMTMGAVLLRTGTVNGSELGGLAKSMPQTTGFCIIGAASISAFPLFSGFVSKSLIMIAAAEAHYDLTWFLLLFAAAGVFHHAGIKIPFFAFFAHDSGRRVEEAPLNMRLAMAVAAAVCIFNGCYPQLLYSLLPMVMDYHPYDVFHVVSQLQLLFFSALAFAVLMLTKLYPPELRSVNLDSDFIYRSAAKVTRALHSRVLAPLGRGIQSLVLDRAPGFFARALGGPGPGLLRVSILETSALLLGLLLLGYLVLNFFQRL